MSTNPLARHRGFTLIEIMVVLVISAGLVALMAGLYRTVAQSALALRSGKQEWLLQRQLRDQSQHLFSTAKTPLHPIVGRPSELYLTTWQSRAAGVDGKPVIAYFHYNENDRTLYYHEQPLPPWWAEAASMYNPDRMQAELRDTPPRKLVTGIAELDMLYLPGDAPDTLPERWQHQWSQEKPPALIQLRFTKAGKNYSIWFETRTIDT